MAVRAQPAEPADPDALDLAALGSLATLARSADGPHYLALSDGWRRIRIDVVDGEISEAACVRLDYCLSGFRDLEARLEAVRRLARLRREGRLARDASDEPTGMPRRLEALRVADALRDGASYRDVAVALFGQARVRSDWRTRSDYLLSRVRRRAREATDMLRGGYRALLSR